jgi:hypothetical protein
MSWSNEEVEAEDDSQMNAHRQSELKASLTWKMASHRMTSFRWTNSRPQTRQLPCREHIAMKAASLTAILC